MLLPTPRLAALLIGGAAVFAVGVVVDAARFLGIWIDVALAAAALADAALCPRRRQFEITRAAPARVGRGEGLAVETTIRRKLGFLETLLDRREDAPPSFIPVAAAGSPAGATRVRPGESLVLRSLWRPAERGVFVLSGVAFRALSPLRLFVSQWQDSLAVPIEVDPQPRGVERGILAVRTWLQQQGSRPVRLRGRASEFEQLRDHVEGDEFRAMDWKATARRGIPTVREYRTERNREVSILLDVGRRMSSRFLGESKCDAALEAALGLARVALEAGDRVGFLTFASTPQLDVPARRGKPHYRAIFEAARHAATLPLESSLTAALRYHRARHRKRSFFLVLTDLPDPITARRATPALAAAARRHQVFFVAIDDPQRRALEEAAVAVPEDAYVVAAARRLQRERVEVLAGLRRAGIACADLLPNEISGAVVDEYLEAAAGEEF